MCIMCIEIAKGAVDTKRIAQLGAELVLSKDLEHISRFQNAIEAMSPAKQAETMEELEDMLRSVGVI